MSGLFASLNSSVKALQAQSRAIEIAGKNLANVNNPNYARQRVVFGDRGTVETADGARSLGLEALGVEQLRDTLLDRQATREISLLAAYSAEQQAYQRAQAGLGQSIDRTSTANSTSASANTGLGAALDGFFNVFQSFAASPTDIGVRQALLQQTSILTDRFQLADQRLSQVQSDLDVQIASDVDEVNRLLQSVADLNSQIGRFEVNAPGSAIDLRDQRQAQLEKLAAKISFETRDSSGGQVQIVVKDPDGADVTLVDLTSVVNPLQFDNGELTAGASATVVNLTGGSIRGAMVARGETGAVQLLRNDLDQIARQLVTAVNGIYNPDGTGADFFDEAGLTAGSIRLDGDITATNLKASNGGPAGDNTAALEIARLVNRVFSTENGDHIDGTLGGAFSNAVTKLGQSLSAANARVENQQKIEQLVRTQRDSLTGVSLDEEMADLLKFQRAFQASSRVFGVVDDLLDLVVNQLGRR